MKDLELTVSYLRALYQQQASSTVPAFGLIESEEKEEGNEKEIEEEEEVTELMGKRVFMVEEDRNYRSNKRGRKEEDKVRAKKE